MLYVCTYLYKEASPQRLFPSHFRSWIKLMALACSLISKHSVFRPPIFIASFAGRKVQMASMATFKLPKVENESNVGGNCLASTLSATSDHCKHYALQSLALWLIADLQAQTRCLELHQDPLTKQLTPRNTMQRVLRNEKPLRLHFK